MIKVATVFSGIGAAEQALKQLGVEHKIAFACDNGERYLSLETEQIQEIMPSVFTKVKSYVIIKIVIITILR